MLWHKRHSPSLCQSILLSEYEVPNPPWSMGVVTLCCGAAFLQRTGRLILIKETYFEILGKNLLPSMRALKIKRGWISQLNNDPKHSGRVMTEPSHSIQKRIDDSFKEDLHEEWTKIPTTACENLVKCYRKRSKVLR